MIAALLAAAWGVSVFDTYVDRLKAAQTLRVEAKVTILGGGPTTVSLYGQKPSSFRLTGDGVDSDRFELSKALKNPLAAAFAPFFDPKALGPAKPLGSKDHQGVRFELYRFAFAESTLTLYLDPATALPRRGEFELRLPDEKVIQIVEFSTVELDSALPAGIFEVPKAVATPSGKEGAYQPKYRLTLKLEPGEVPYKRLTFDDYPVRDDAGPWDAGTVGFCRYSYRASVSGSGSQFRARASNLLVATGFNKKDSWRHSKLHDPDNLLEHEQGHLDLHEIYTRDLAMLTPSQVPVGTGSSPDGAAADLERKLSELFNGAISACQREADRYDGETQHGANRSKQREWTAAIRRRLLG